MRADSSSTSTAEAPLPVSSESASLLKLKEPSKPILIIDTDIGDDVDDSWALACCAALQQRGDIDIRLIVTAFGDKFRLKLRAKIAKKILTAAGLADEIPIALGRPTWGAREGAGKGGEDKATICSQTDWVKGDPDGFTPGHEDGVKSMISVIKSLPEGTVVRLLSLAPMSNIAALVKGAPDLIPRIKIVAMAGSIERGYANKRAIPAKEHNIKCDPDAARVVFAANWYRSILVPLDVSGTFKIGPVNYQKLVAHAEHSTLVRCLLDGYCASLDGGLSCVSMKKGVDDIPVRSMIKGVDDMIKRVDDIPVQGEPLRSTILYDVVAAAFATERGRPWPDDKGRPRRDEEWDGHGEYNGLYSPLTPLRLRVTDKDDEKPDMTKKIQEEDGDSSSSPFWHCALTMGIDGSLHENKALEHMEEGWVKVLLRTASSSPTAKPRRKCILM